MKKTKVRNKFAKKTVAAKKVLEEKQASSKEVKQKPTRKGPFEIARKINELIDNESAFNPYAILKIEKSKLAHWSNRKCGADFINKVNAAFAFIKIRDGSSLCIGLLPQSTDGANIDSFLAFSNLERLTTMILASGCYTEVLVPKPETSVDSFSHEKLIITPDIDEDAEEDEDSDVADEEKSKRFDYRCVIQPEQGRRLNANKLEKLYNVFIIESSLVATLYYTDPQQAFLALSDYYSGGKSVVKEKYPEFLICT